MRLSILENSGGVEMNIKSYAANEPKGVLEPFEYDPGEMQPDQVEMDVLHCGICHSDLNMLDNDWQMTQYPFVPGHEIVGKVSAVGNHVSRVKPGDLVGVGWFSGSCMYCEHCLSGDHNLCSSIEQIIIGRYGGFANKVRAHQVWTTPLPEGIDVKSAGPLFCAGITVFNPIVQNDLKSSDRVAVVGIGGLGHLALQFLNAWGCEVTAISTSLNKEEEAKRMGAHHFLNSSDKSLFEKSLNAFDMILVTSTGDLDWDAYIPMIRPKGKLHFVGALPSVTATAFPMIAGQKSIGASPLGSPANMREMLLFTSRHSIEPMIESYPLTKVNDAMERLRSGKARYRIVLDNDL
jgi:uncharacterized zinc-type alcohol dehydrogenase-like protein